MALKLIVDEKMNFFNGKLYIGEDPSRYTLFRVFIPVFLFIGLLIVFVALERKNLKDLFLASKEKILLTHDWKWYFLFLIIAFFLFSLIPGFLLLIKNLNAYYGFFDADSYVSQVMIMLRGDYNANYVAEGGLQFGKYYPITMPTLILSFLGGIGNLVSFYNVVVSFYVFFILLNISMIFINLFEDDSNFSEYMGKFLFFFVFLALLSRFIAIRDYFNYDPFLQVYTNGFYGVIGGIFLFSSALFCLNHLIQEEITDDKRNSLLLLHFFVFGTMIAQAYFNLLLFYLPIAGGFLTIFITRKNSWRITGKLMAIFFLSLIVLWKSYLALDIYPDFGVKAQLKLIMISVFLGITYLIFIFMNRLKDDFIFHFFKKWQFMVVPFICLAPFLLFFKTARGMYDDKPIYKIVSWVFPIQIEVGDLNNTRLFLITLLFLILFFACLLFFVFNRFFQVKQKKFFYHVVLVLIFSSVILVNTYNPRKVLPLRYPTVYSPNERIMDLKNNYVFDQDGVRVGYNGYLVDVAKFFVRQEILDMYFWIVSETPARGIYEHGLLTRMLSQKGHKLEGVTITDVKTFAKNIFNLEKKTRSVELAGYQNRFLILDNNFPQEILKEMETSLLFKKVYENKLYCIYRLEFIKKNYVIF